LAPNSARCAAADKAQGKLGTGTLVSSSSPTLVGGSSCEIY